MGCPSRMRSGISFVKKNKIDWEILCNGRYKLVYQNDGNIVLTDSAKDNPAPPVSVTGEPMEQNDDGYTQIKITQDGLVYYTHYPEVAGVAGFWHTQTASRLNYSDGYSYELQLQNDGNLVLYRIHNKGFVATPIWDLKTEVRLRMQVGQSENNNNNNVYSAPINALPVNQGVKDFLHKCTDLFCL